MHIDKKILLVFGIPQNSFFKKLKRKQVIVAELRPGLEGAKIVAKEALEYGLKPVVICDNMMAFCMNQGLVKDVHIFYYALNKKVSLCRTGSLIAALCAKFHKIPVYLHAAKNYNKPSSLLQIDGMNVTSQDLKTYVPFFEEVPLKLVRMQK